MKEILIYFSLYYYLVQFVVVFSTLSITSLILFSAQSTVFHGPKNLQCTRTTRSSIYILCNDFTFADTVWKSNKELEHFTQAFRDMSISLSSSHYSLTILVISISILTFSSPTFAFISSYLYEILE